LKTFSNCSEAVKRLKKSTRASPFDVVLFPKIAVIRVTSCRQFKTNLKRRRLDHEEWFISGQVPPPFCETFFVEQEGCQKKSRENAALEF
jgi:hypothetical protein